MLAAIVVVLIMQIVPTAPQRDDEVLRAEVARLVRQLDADEFATRQAARRALLRLGPDAIDDLPDPKSVTSPEVRAALEQLLSELRSRQVLETLKPTVVTLTDTLTVDQIADRLFRQTGNRLSVAGLSSGMRGTRLTLAYHQETFWHVVLDVAEKLGVGVRASSGVVRLEESLPAPAAHTAHGPFVLLAAAAKRRPLVGEPDMDLLRVPLSFTAEPRLRCLFVNVADSDITIRHQAAEVLTPFSPDRRLELPVGDRGELVRWTHDVTLPHGVEVDRVQVQGEVKSLVAAGYDRFIFPAPGSGQKQRQSRRGVALVLGEVQQSADSDRVRVQLTVDWLGAANAFDSYRTWVFHNAAWLEGPDGQRIAFFGPVRTDAQVGGAVRLTYEFRNVSVPLSQCRFIYEAPTKLETVTVPFDLTNIPVVGP